MSMPANPFAVLGLPEWPDLDDETVRAAWRAIAADTNTARADGGNLARYTQATAAFHQLRTPWSRSEAYADLVEQAWAEGRYDDYPDRYSRGHDPDDQPQPPWPIVIVLQPPPPLQPIPPREIVAMITRIPARIRHGHPVRMLTRAAAVAGLCLAALTLIPSQFIATYAVLVLAFVFVIAARQDLALAPPPRRGPSKTRQVTGAAPSGSLPTCQARDPRRASPGGQAGPTRAGQERPGLRRRAYGPPDMPGPAPARTPAKQPPAARARAPAKAARMHTGKGDHRNAGIPKRPGNTAR